MTMLARSGDAAHSNRLGGAMVAAQARIRDSQIEVATGKRAQTYETLGRDSGFLLRAKDSRQLAVTFAAEGQKIDDRLQVMDGAVSAIAEIAERMRARVVQRLDASTGDAAPLTAEARSMLDEVASQLNQKLDGRYLFSGSRIDTAPVALPTGAIVSIDASLYYRGDDDVAAARLDAGSEVGYGVTAAEAPFATLIGALGQAIEAHEADDDAGLRSALDRLDLAVGGLAELRGRMGASGARVEAIVDRQRGTSTYLDEVVSRIEDADIPAATSRLAQDQLALQAAYLTSSRLSSLSLAEYLR